MVTESTLHALKALSFVKNFAFCTACRNVVGVVVSDCNTIFKTQCRAHISIKYDQIISIGRRN